MKRLIKIIFLMIYSLNNFSQAINETESSIYVDLKSISNILSSRSEKQIISLSDSEKFTFEVIKNDILSKEFSHKNPEISTYFIIKENKIIGSFTYSPDGVFANYLYNGENISISPNWTKRENIHKIKIGYDSKVKLSCDVIEEGLRSDYATTIKLDKHRTDLVKKLSFRIAIIATGEFTNANGGTVASAQATIAASVNGINEFYLKQLGITFNLVSTHVFTNHLTDPFIPDNNNGALSRENQAGIAFSSILNNNTYDIGHVLHTHDISGDEGWSFGGISKKGSICQDSNFQGGVLKASGWSGHFSNNNLEWLFLFAHEVGHQIGMSHTSNGVGDICTDLISENTAVEIGSGTTLMSLKGLCSSSHNVPSNGAIDGYFHYINVLEASIYLNNSNLNCYTEIVTNNNHPQSNVNPCNVPQYKIPKLTPFYIKSESTDEDGDTLYHSWEQINEDGPGSPTQGSIGNIASNSNQNAPLFKNYPPSISNERYFPSKNSVVKGLTSDPFEVLPNRPRQLTFAYSSRDHRVVPAGGISYDEFNINVEDNGPLIITHPAKKDTIYPGKPFSVNWKTNGSDQLCNTAQISLSIDGGYNFPYILKENVSYSSGHQSVSVPNSMNFSNNVRIKVECTDYDCFKFYAISQDNIILNSKCDVPSSIICPSNDVITEKGSNLLNFNLQTKKGIIKKSFSKLISGTSQNIGRVIMYNETSTGCKDVTNNYFKDLFFSVDEKGEYTFIVDKDNQDGSGFITIINDAVWDPKNPCNNGFIGSTAHASENNGFFFNDGKVTVTLDECVVYRMLLYNFGELPINTVVSSISGPGNIIEISPNDQSNNFSHTYLALKKPNQIISAISSESDFTSLNDGDYTICGLYYESTLNNTDLKKYIGRRFQDFHIEGNCYKPSTNSFNLTINGNCIINNVEIINQGYCDTIDSTYNQEVLITYKGTPSGNIVLGGKIFDINSNPQIISLKTKVNESSNEIPVYIESEPNCVFYIGISNPVPQLKFDNPICEKTTINLPNINDGTWEIINGVNHAFITNNKLNAISEGEITLSFKPYPSCYGIVVNQIHNKAILKTPNIITEDSILCVGKSLKVVTDDDSDELKIFNLTGMAVFLENETISTSLKGTFFISSKSKNNCIGYSDTLYVNDTTEIQNIGFDTLCIGGSTKLTTSSTGIWKSKNESIAFISDIGEISALNIGNSIFSFVDSTTRCESKYSNIEIYEELELTLKDDRICKFEIENVELNFGKLYSIDSNIVQIINPSSFIGVDEGNTQLILSSKYSGCLQKISDTIYVFDIPDGEIIGNSTITVGDTTFMIGEGILYSENSLIAAINSQGIIIGTGVGKTKIIIEDSITGCKRFLNINVLAAESKIYGLVYFDSNMNKLLDLSDPPIQGAMISINDYYTVISKSDGSYSLPVTLGNHRVKFKIPFGSWVENPILIEEHVNDVNLKIDQGFISVFNSIDTASSSLLSGIMRCNTNVPIYFSTINLGSNILSGKMELKFPSNINVVSTYPLPDNITDKVYTWNFINIQPGDIFKPEIIVSPVGNPGDKITFYSKIYNFSNVILNENVYNEIIRCSFDPNDKLCFPNRNTEDKEILINEMLEYTIRFQNTGNDTAFYVEIIDELDLNLDPSTITNISSSHKVETSITGNIIKFVFNNINLPDSITNKIGSQGYVSFKVKSVQEIVDGYKMMNSAKIIFDKNPPIVTNSVLNTVVMYLTCNGIEKSLIQVGDSLIASSGGLEYHWYNCRSNNIIAITTKPYFKPDLKDEYYVVIYGIDCRIKSNCISVTTGTENFDIDRIVIYPNPTPGLLEVKYNKQIINIELYDIMGQLISTSFDLQTMDLSKMAVGTYFVKVYTKNGVLSKLITKF